MLYTFLTDLLNIDNRKIKPFTILKKNIYVLTCSFQPCVLPLATKTVEYCPNKIIGSIA